MASIREIKNKNGDLISYKITVYDGMRNGKKVHKTKTVTLDDLGIPVSAPIKIKRAINKAAVEFENEVRNGTDFSNGNKVRFNELMEKWNDNVLAVKVVNGDISEGCREHYIRMIQLYAFDELSSMLLNKIRPSNIDSTIRGMTSRGLSKKTVRNYFNCLHQCFQYAVRNMLISDNPCNNVSALPQAKRNHDLHTFSQEQAQRFLNDALKVDIPRSHAWKKQMDQLYFTIMLYAGFRKSELLAITWNDIDYAKCTITINKAVGYNDSDKEFIKSPKTESGKRIIKLPAICFQMLNEWKYQSMEICMKAGKSWRGFRGKHFDKNYIFIREDGRRMSMREPLKHFHLILEEYNRTVPEKMQLPLIRLHDLRHTCASHLVAAGTDIETVAHRLGHSNPSFTLDVYAHALEEKDQGAADALEKLFAENKG